VGLVSKIRRVLIEDGYAIDYQKRLHLLDPIALLKNWSQKYSGPLEQIPMYVLGDLAAAETTSAHWCHKHGLRNALAGFSAAWRLAPEVRHSVAMVYVEEHGFDERLLDDLASQFGVKRAESGANLLLWRPFDPSVFASSKVGANVNMPVTSPLQSYLDLKRMAGRGEEAATAIYDKHLRNELQSAANRGKAIQHAHI
jgi:hypothetical protein